MTSTEIFSVSRLNVFIRDVVASGFPSSLWVCGEIQNLDRYKSKAHLFFDLVEKDADSKEIKAKLGVTIWSGVRPKIEALLKKAENAFELKDGIEVKFSGKVDFYPPYGTLRFVIDNIDPVYTLGKIAQDRQRLIAELEAAGVLARNKARLLGDVPLSIGLISSYDSAAYNDFMHELGQSGFAFRVSFFNAVMQGKNCAPSVCEGLKVMEGLEDLDVVVITRGGGSIAELSAFDSRSIALAIAGSRYPVVTGIGHEINTSIADLAAHTFAKTPTAVAQFLALRVRSALERLDAACARLMSAGVQSVADNRSRLKDNALRFQEQTRRWLQSRKDHHVRLLEQLNKAPLKACGEARRDIVADAQLLQRNISLRLKAASSKTEALSQLIAMASPARILRRGFSVTRLASGKLVRARADAHHGDEIITELPDGTLTSTVQISINH
jgi:exodeoxyribonuclease VII large subunit